MEVTEQTAIQAESTSNNFPVEKPADRPYLRFRILHLLSKADREPNSEKRYAILERVRDLSLSLRKQGGFLTWSAAAVAIVVVGFLLAAVVKNWPKSYFYTYPSDYLRVIQRLNDRDFIVQRVENGIPQEQTMMRFCSDYLPWFEGGHILQWIRYNDHGSCQSIGPDNRGFDVVRDSKGVPVISPNCHFDWSTPNGHVVCEGGTPKFD